MEGPTGSGSGSGSSGSHRRNRRRNHRRGRSRGDGGEIHRGRTPLNPNASTLPRCQSDSSLVSSYQNRQQMQYVQMPAPPQDNPPYLPLSLPPQFQNPAVQPFYPWSILQVHGYDPRYWPGASGEYVVSRPYLYNPPDLILQPDPPPLMLPRTRSAPLLCDNRQQIQNAVAPLTPPGSFGMPPTPPWANTPFSPQGHGAYQMYGPSHQIPMPDVGGSQRPDSRLISTTYWNLSPTSSYTTPKPPGKN